MCCMLGMLPTLTFKKQPTGVETSGARGEKSKYLVNTYYKQGTGLGQRGEHASVEFSVIEGHFM